MKKLMLIWGCICFCVMGLRAQAEDEPVSGSDRKFKPHYVGTSVDASVMFTSGFGSAYYIAPKISFQATPRLFFNAGIGLMQVGLMPSQTKSDLFPGRTSVNAYIFAEGTYLLNERWSINGSVMKDVSSGPVRQVSPYSVPSEAMHFGVDYRLTPNITIGARVGYSNGRRSNMYHDPFNPF